MEKILSEKAESFLSYAKKKKWDASLLFYNGKFVAILNPVNRPKIYQGESKSSMDDAITDCSQQLKKDKNK